MPGAGRVVIRADRSKGEQTSRAARPEGEPPPESFAQTVQRIGPPTRKKPPKMR